MIFLLLSIFTSFGASWKQYNQLVRSTSLMSVAKKLSPSAALINKGKKKLVETLLKEIESEGENHIINQFLTNNVRPFGVGPPPNFYNASKTNTHGTIAIFPEYNLKAKTGFIIGLPPPEILGGVVREAGAKSIIISMDTRSGGCSLDFFLRFAKVIFFVNTFTTKFETKRTFI
jgi:hypothetical protein